MAKTKAAFFGECQVCGQKQKLPGSTLSLHGYTVEWEFFANICPGSQHLPYEQSTDLIQHSITSAEASAAHLDRYSDRLELPATEAKAWCYVYRDQRQCRGDEKAGYIMVEGSISKAEEPYCGQWFTVTGPHGQIYHIASERHRDDVLVVATYHNRMHAKRIRAKAAKYRKYIAVQTERLAKWEPKELTPIPGEVPIVHFEATKYGIATVACAASIRTARANQWRARTTDPTKVTCVGCRKRLELSVKQASKGATECHAG